jgi:hypothetical protein
LQWFQTIIPTKRAGIIKNSGFAQWERLWKAEDPKLNVSVKQPWKSTRKAVSALCRMALWQWVFTRIEVMRMRPKNDIGKKLGEMLDYEKVHKPVKLARSRVAAKAATMLFKELVASIHAEYNQI